MLETGKLDSELLKEIVFDTIRYRRDEVITRPGIGEDCAEIDFGEYICTVSTDPITASVRDIGRLSIHISCNDIASNGIQPIGIMLSVLLPVGTTEDDIRRIMGQAASAAEQMEVEIIGGHTEITEAVNQPVITSTAIGRDSRDRKQYEAKAGDLIFVTKTVGIEGTGIIATEREEDLLADNILNKEEIIYAKKMLDRVSVVKEGVAAGRVGFSAMHDITEGGVLGAVWEVCRVTGLGAEVSEADIPVDPVTRKLCGGIGVDVLRLISSGSMLIVAPPEKEEELRESIDEISCIGKMTGEGVYMDGKPVDPPSADEIYTVFPKTEYPASLEQAKL